MESNDPRQGCYTSSGLRLNYVDWGNGDAPPLLLIHGGEDHARSWDWAARALRRDFHVIAPDLRGHGDSDWSPDADYSMGAYLCDLAELIEQLDLAPMTIVGHSLGAGVALRYAGVFPEKVAKLVSIEGLRPARPETLSIDQRLRSWVGARRRLTGATRRSYPSIEGAMERMRSVNGHLSEEQVRHLSLHGVTRNAEGGYSWKFDPRLRARSPIDLSDAEIHDLWSRITCPVWLAYGAQSWASNPAEDGRIAHFQNSRLSLFADAGHWVHHDSLGPFLAGLRRFLGSPPDEPEPPSGSAPERRS